MTTPARVAALVREHAATVDPWLREAAGRGVDVPTARAALTDLEPVLAHVTPRAGLALVRATIGLVARGRWHAGAAPRAVVLHVLPRLAAWLDAWPDEVAPAVLTASRAVTRGGVLDAWTALLAQAPPPASAVHVRPALLVAGWRCGLARYRGAALDAAAPLPPVLAGAVLGVAAADVPATLARHREDRWWWPGRDQGPGVVQRVGGFAGWGGPWLGVPRVAAGGPTGWLVLVDGTVGAVVADVHGSAVVGQGEQAQEPADPPRPPARSLQVPWADEVTGAVPDATGTVLLVARAHSCALDVVRQGRAA